jgi:MFS family permease
MATTVARHQSVDFETSPHLLMRAPSSGSAQTKNDRSQPVDDAVVSDDLGTGSTKPSNLSIVLAILQPSLMNFFVSFSTGGITVGIPVIARAIDLPRSLYLWPSSVFGLTCGSLLLIAGSLSDLLGPKRVELAGCFLLSVFMLASGFAQTGSQLVAFRALMGVGNAMHLPAAVAIVANAVPRGRPRNIGFGVLGLSQPLGFSAGLVANGIMIDKLGWRSGFYLAGAVAMLITLVMMRGLPDVKAATSDLSIWRRMWSNIDWVGGIIASGGLAMIAYVLA